MTPSEDILTIDPVAMNVVNRVAAGSSLVGQLSFEGGVLVQGRLGGEVHVSGRMIVWSGGVLKGTVKVAGDMFVFGQVGELGAPPHETQVDCTGTLYIANTGVSTGVLRAQNLMLYDGADLQGPFMTLKPGQPSPIVASQPPPPGTAAPPQRAGPGNV